MIELELKKQKQLISFLEQKNENSLLRFITCGSVDDGKSTLIGRLLFETETIFNNELKVLQKDSQKYGTTGEDIDFSLLVDGLSAEREQGITIDVAYRFFSTKKRSFIVADTPGHEQYTRNMATGASTADLAILLIDARKGILTQTKRHSFIVSLFGVKQVIVVVNKMDLIDYCEMSFNAIQRDYFEFAKKLTFKKINILPISALKGDNIYQTSTKTPWYQGENLIALLEAANPKQFDSGHAFRFPVQWINRPNPDFRGFSGTVSSGSIKSGSAIKIYPSGQTTTIKDIITWEGSQKIAEKGQSITITLTDEIDISRGDVISEINSPCNTSNQFQVTLLWMTEKSMIRGRQYLLKCATQTAVCIPDIPKYKIDVHTMEHLATDNLSLNEIGICNINLNKTIVFEPYEKNKELGSFILIDRITNDTVACGWFNFSLRRSDNIHQQKLLIGKKERSAIKIHKPCVLWFTGISGAGKSTIANRLEQKLNDLHVHSVLLDGDNIRHGLNKDLGFTEQDRAENIRRIAEVAKLMCDAGLVCLVAVISPFKAERMMAKELIGQHEFFEIFIDTSLETAEKRDVKGLYKKARAGKLKNFTGIDSSYEIPQQPDIDIKTQLLSAEEAVDNIICHLKIKEVI